MFVSFYLRLLFLILLYSITSLDSTLRAGLSTHCVWSAPVTSGKAVTVPSVIRCTRMTTRTVQWSAVTRVTAGSTQVCTNSGVSNVFV